MAKKDLSNSDPLPQMDGSEPGPAAETVVSPMDPAPVNATSDLPNPHAGGRYTRDPVTGRLTCTEPATQVSAVRKTQDQVTGAITRNVTDITQIVTPE